jgi:hypothetical protein
VGGLESLDAKSDSIAISQIRVALPRNVTVTGFGCTIHWRDQASWGEGSLSQSDDLSPSTVAEE